jgi:hypothetical protein
MHVIDSGYDYMSFFFDNNDYMSYLCLKDIHEWGLKGKHVWMEL